MLCYRCVVIGLVHVHIQLFKPLRLDTLCLTRAIHIKPTTSSPNAWICRISQASTHPSPYARRPSCRTHPTSLGAHAAHHRGGRNPVTCQRTKVLDRPPTTPRRACVDAG